MEGLMVLFGLALAGIAFLLPIVSFLLALGNQRQLRALEETVIRLQGQLNARPRPRRGVARAPVPVPREAQPAPPQPAPAPAPPPSPPQPVVAAAALAARDTGAGAARCASGRAPSAPAAEPAAAACRRGPPPPAPRPAPRAAERRRRLLTGRAWSASDSFSAVAGIALVFAAIFFLRFSIERGWLQPPVRVAIGVLTGVGLLVVCERRAARRYPITANALDAAAVSILFATFAAHALWQLIPVWLTFLLLALVAAGGRAALDPARVDLHRRPPACWAASATPALLCRRGRTGRIPLFAYPAAAQPRSRVGGARARGPSSPA